MMEKNKDLILDQIYGLDLFHFNLTDLTVNDFSYKCGNIPIGSFPT